MVAVFLVLLLQLHGLRHSVSFLLINTLEISLKLLFFKSFRSSPKKLWITLLKTLLDTAETLEK